MKDHTLHLWDSKYEINFKVGNAEHSPLRVISFLIDLLGCPNSIILSNLTQILNLAAFWIFRISLGRPY